MAPPVRRILLIDDDPVDRDVLSYRLRQDGGARFEVRAAESGRKGLGLIRDWRPDCVLLDLNLPDIAGLELLRAALGESRAPVIVITAHGSEEIAAGAMREGAADYLIKGSLSGSALGHTIEKALEREELRRQIEERNRDLEAGLVRERAARTAAEESERRYRTLAEAIPQIVWTARHPSGEFDYVNERWTNMTGLPGEAASAHGWTAALHPEDRARIAQKWSEARRTGRPFEAECRLRSADDSFRWNLIRAVPVSALGQTRMWLGTFTDLEEQKRAEQLLRQRQKLESIGLLAGGIAHDFNNLLVGILGAVSYALDVLAPDHEVRNMLEVALASGERAAHLVRQMLAYAGKGRFLVEKVDLTDLVLKTWELVRTSIPSSIQVQFLTREELPALETDASQIEQIVMNLMINAAEAIPAERRGRIIVRTDLERIEDPLANTTSDLAPGQYLVLEVRDNGCGMDEGTKARIFDPFYTTKFTGRGLGLAAVQGIVRNNQGAILVDSTPGQGTSFRILLPPANAAAGAANVIHIDEPRAGDGARILVVDDEEMVLSVARAALERAGYAVETASSGPQAIEKLRWAQEPFALVLLDMSMPAMSGIEALSGLRDVDSAVPILLSSGYSEAEMRRQAEGLDVAGFLQKPYSSKNLRDLVAAQLRGSALARMNRTAG